MRYFLLIFIFSTVGEAIAQYNSADLGLSCRYTATNEKANEVYFLTEYADFKVFSHEIVDARNHEHRIEEVNVANGVVVYSLGHISSSGFAKSYDRTESHYRFNYENFKGFNFAFRISRDTGNASERAPGLLIGLKCSVIDAEVVEERLKSRVEELNSYQTSEYEQTEQEYESKRSRRKF